MSNFRIQDIYRERESLNNYSEYTATLIAFPNCLAEPIPNDALKSDTMFQIVDVRDPSVSILSTIEQLTNLVNLNDGFHDRSSKLANTGSNKKRKKIINEVNINEDEQESNSYYNQNSSGKLGRLTLQDCFGNSCYAYVYNGPLSEKLNDILNFTLGSKLIVYKGTRISFNTLHLRAENYKNLGGFIKRLNFEVHKRKLKELKLELQYEE